eukprot:CAMPEP_0118952330 /NCGR_PEP_ID=MMETSP1169-20130426/54653_1 /TAXON_ID=36882 /ORGANISM="Pyramimonas obovata, Strain CCMP722" /LENGTH=58 /DNA_ID=CAMNT_0006899551 /DNA_START=90 /DNA_END=263 /DNA_ORIENTATION=-
MSMSLLIVFLLSFADLGCGDELEQIQSVVPSALDDMQRRKLTQFDNTSLSVLQRVQPS